MVRLGRDLFAAAAIITMSAVAVSEAGAYPKPSPVLVRWQMNFEPGPLRLHQAASGESYWYFTYKVTNRTGREQIWAPSLVLFTDVGEIMPSGPPRSKRKRLVPRGTHVSPVATL